jgi:hypothetical protein
MRLVDLTMSKQLLILERLGNHNYIKDMEVDNDGYVSVSSTVATVIEINNLFAVQDINDEILYMSDSLEDCLDHAKINIDYVFEYDSEIFCDYVSYKYYDEDRDEFYTNKTFDEMLSDFDDLYQNKIKDIFDTMKIHYNDYKNYDTSEMKNPRKVKSAIEYIGRRFETKDISSLAYQIEDIRTMLKKNYREYYDYIALNFARGNDFRDYRETLFYKSY